MTDHTPEWDEQAGPGDADGTDAAQEVAAGSQELAEDDGRTGVEEVDDVLASTEGLEDRPVDEHVGVFENAHDQLRRALDGRTEG